MTWQSRFDEIKKTLQDPAVNKGLLAMGASLLTPVNTLKETRGSHMANAILGGLSTTGKLRSEAQKEKQSAAESSSLVGLRGAQSTAVTTNAAANKQKAETQAAESPSVIAAHEAQAKASEAQAKAINEKLPEEKKKLQAEADASQAGADANRALADYRKALAEGGGAKPGATQLLLEKITKAVKSDAASQGKTVSDVEAIREAKAIMQNIDGKTENNRQLFISKVVQDAVQYLGGKPEEINAKSQEIVDRAKRLADRIFGPPQTNTAGNTPGGVQANAQSPAPAEVQQLYDNGIAPQMPGYTLSGRTTMRASDGAIGYWVVDQNGKHTFDFFPQDVHKTQGQ